MFLIIKLLVVCKIFRISLAVERKSSAALEKLSEVIQYCDVMTSEFLDTYLIEEAFVKRYAQRQLNETGELKEVLLGSLFPGKIDSKIDESYCRSKLNKEKLSSEQNFTSHFNGYLIKVNEEWKIRKVENGEITYSNIEGGNVMELVEFLFVFGFNRGTPTGYRANKMLTLIQIKYQLEEDLKETGRSMCEFEEEFWRENDLESNLIREALNQNAFVHEFEEINKADEVFMGARGEKSVAVDQVKREIFGNMTFAELFKSYLDNFFSALELNVESLGQKIFKDDIEITTANDYSKEIATNENEENFVADNQMDKKFENNVSIEVLEAGHTTTKPQPRRTNKEKHQKMKQKLSKEQIERTKILPMKFSKKKLPCNTHLRKALKKNKESYKYWKPFCNPDGSYKTTEKICRKRQCWCVDNKGMFLKQIFRTSDIC